ncbi:CubicO group peptidase (beta-lactamase class C family) [Kineococcus radiotolerans]|uniref:CubicO group peptidase (Beta-lactamase class C family) n=1 Tax=Kineococcus radiotolerans TaxID=131568 RepID=A0A7W4TNG8_KINRA|nr:serine hydrolase domain-containing protein [Kineococcus radiotolerans]MBB2902166.1 CubicO group peptidase (beta-lactamase class C family) [Kineococcus radiotolerans]
MSGADGSPGDPGGPGDPGDPDGPDDPGAPLRAALRAGVRAGSFPGASAVSSAPDGTVRRAVAGTLAPGDPDPVTPGTRADLGAVTEVFTAVVVHAVAEVGAVDLDRPTGRGFTLAQLLAHTSGLPADSDARHRGDLRPAQRLQRVLDAPLESAPGTVTRPSRVGYVVAGHLVEEATGQGLDALVEEFVTAPLGLRGPVFGTAGAPVAGPVLATGGGTARGVVHDGLAASLRRPAGNAGLFGTAEEVHALGRALLEGTLLPPGAWRRVSGGEGLRAGGTGGTAPHLLGRTGSTGASLLLDPRAGSCVVLLTGRGGPGAARPGPVGAPGPRAEDLLPPA